MRRAEQRLEHLAETHGPRVLAYLARRTDPADAADVFQEVLMVAWRRLSDVPADEQAALVWLLAVARRCLANDRRSQTRRLRATQRLSEAIQVSSPSDTPDGHPSITEALTGLSDVDRELVTLVYWEDLTIEQAAEVLDLFAPAARKRLERARTRLRAYLETSRVDAACEPR